MSEASGRQFMETTRLEVFSDGVLAIVITLLVLDIRVPSPEATEHGRALIPALVRIWPSYLGYALSFMHLGIVWVNHHAVFRYVKRANRSFLLLNVVFLMCVAIVPFATALMAEYLPEPEGRTTAMAVYSVAILMIGVSANVLWRYAAAAGRLLDPSADPAVIRRIGRRLLLAPAAYLVALALAYVNPWACLFLHVALAAFYSLPEHRALALVRPEVPPARAAQP